MQLVFQFILKCASIANASSGLYLWFWTSELEKKPNKCNESDYDIENTAEKPYSVLIVFLKYNNS